MPSACPLQDQILSFLHTFSAKSACVRGPCPPTGNPGSTTEKSEPHNAAHYQRQLEQQLAQHDDVIHRLVDIMKMDDYFRRTEDLPMIDPLVVYDEVEQFPELFDAKEAVSRISTEVNIIERQMCRPGMYPILQSPVPTTSGFVLHRPASTFKPINSAPPSPAAGASQQGSFNSLL